MCNMLARYTKKGLLHNRGVLAIIIVSLPVVFLILMALSRCFLRRQRRAGRARKSKNIFSFTSFKDSLGEKEIDESRRNGDLPYFDLGTIAAATNNFSSDNKLGQGGFGPGYKMTKKDHYWIGKIVWKLSVGLPEECCISTMIPG
ncbi:hypothetical protein PVK06_036553 [Gossypium arboreum]|uniref:Uncharacterized protein n=1 Tax=Gossypium arboreum TaxID=29729 RepID=A0ABR0NJV2_GOSAR|nr:hypothetical protein PVK06_036553 [Gossypium arboreum]